MESKITKKDLTVLDESWHKIRKAAVKIIRTKLHDETILVENMIPMHFSKDLILGNGKWGIVLGIPAIPELVMKITTDPFEWFLIEMLKQDKDLAYHPAIPFTVGTAVLNIKVDDMPLYLIIRENLRIGIPLDRTNPLLKAKKILIEDFIVPMEEIEEYLANVINKRKDDINLIEVSVIYGIISGEIKKQISKITAIMPDVSERSEFYWVLDFQKRLLEKGIALVDIHPNNLGTREFDVPYYIKQGTVSGKGCVVISDLGMAYGTPLFLEKGLLYKNIEEMLTHFVKILTSYSDLKKTTYHQNVLENPAEIQADALSSELIDFTYEEIRFACTEANNKLANVLMDPEIDMRVSVIAGKIMNLVPLMHISANLIIFTLKNHVASIINEWIEKDLVLEENDTSVSLKCFIDSVRGNLAKCTITDEFFVDDHRPIAVFEIPKEDLTSKSVKESFSEHMDRKKRLGDFEGSIQYLPLNYLKKMNGVSYERR